jgi:hypothetical protein
VQHFGGGVDGGGAAAAGGDCVAAVLELDVCTDVVLVVTEAGRPLLKMLAAGLLKKPPLVAAVAAVVGPAPPPVPVPDGLVPAKPVPPAGADGGGPGAVAPGAGAERGVIETVVVVLRLLALEALFDVPADAPPVCPGWL